MAEFSVLGTRAVSPEDISKATGSAEFTADLKLPGLLTGKILRSPLPHARIRRIDTSKARRLSGVKAVITADDTGKLKYGVFPSTRDSYSLAVDKVRYIGDEVASLAAVDEATALEAIELIEVEYEELPAVFDPLEAMADGAPVIHDDWPNNLSIDVEMVYGNPEQGFKESDYIREDRFITAALAHAMLEPYVVVAKYDPAGALDIWMPNQSPFTKRRALMRLLGMPMERIRVRKSFIGGTFGGRSEMFSADVCAALLSHRTGRPVKIVYTREETTACTRQKHPFIIDIKTGVKKDGTLVAKEVKVIADGGAYHSTGGIAISNPPASLFALMHVPNFHYLGKRVFTNKSVRGAMKGHGNQQFRFADDVQLDIIARELRLDPVEIRLKNAVRTGDVALNGNKISSCAVRECLEKAASAVDWGRRDGCLVQSDTSPNLKRGKGIGFAPMPCGFSLGMRSGSGAMIRMNEDGQITLFSGVPDNGQGNHLMMAMVAAEVLTIPLTDVNVVAADTEMTPQDPGSYSMSAAYVSANAVKRAAEDARRQLLEIARELLEAHVDDLELRAGKIFIKGSPDKNISVAKTSWEALDRGKHIIGTGSWKPDLGAGNEIDFVRGKIDGQMTGAFAYGAVAVEVEVDVITGKVRVLKAVAAQDCGRAINPQAVEGQIEGSVGFGVGQVLGEELFWSKGSLLNSGFVDYGIPTCLDVCGQVEPIIVESVDPEGPFGAKEAAEAVGVAVIPAIVNAIYDATGVVVKELPITPERMLQALEEKETLR